MAKLVECKSCKHTVDSSAKTCPSCGVSKPGAKGSTRQWIFIGVFLVIAFIAVKNGGDHVTEAAVQSEQMKPDAVVKSEKIKPDNKLETLSVSDYEFTMNDKQAVSISFGKTENNFCTVSIYRDSVAQGYSVSSTQRDDHSISVDCNWNGKYFVESSKHPTISSLSISSLDKNKNIAQVELTLKLVELQGLDSISHWIMCS